MRSSQSWKVVVLASPWIAILACSSSSGTEWSSTPPGKDAGSENHGGSAGSSGTSGGAGTDAGPDSSVEAGCTTGKEQCNGTAHQVCKNGVFVDEPCASGSSCQPSSGQCIACACTPGAKGACVDQGTIQTCDADCMTWTPKPCSTGEICKGDACVAQVCTPGSKACADLSTSQVCNADGTGFDPGATCGPKEQCLGGVGCVSLCVVAEKAPSSVGCSFFALNMDNFNEANPDAVVVGNTSATLTAIVNFYGSPGGVETAIESNVQIPPQGQHTFMIPNGAGDVIESGSALRVGGSFRVASDIPVIAYQHSPLQPQATNDASCLIPESTLGTHYVIGSYTDALGSYPSYFNVVASQDNTSVTFTVPVATQGGTGVPALAANGSTTVVMNRYDTLQVVAPGSDITGTDLTATAPVAVFGAVECAQVPPGATYCDHVEEQSIPVRNWGKKYVGAHAPLRSGTEHFFWRILAQTDNTTVTTTPPQTGFPKTLNKGQFYEFWTTQSFMFEGDQPFAAFQYVSGQDAFNAGTGDPAMITAIPVEQFLKSYVILTPSGYTFDYVQVIRTTADDVIVDGTPIPANEYSPVGAYTVADHKVAAGSHSLTSTSPFGIVGVGYTGVTSYGYPGGFALKDLSQ
ncbi:MAG: IgGFc-binding protein [Deltaproteobacteria bacterium]|nr:IgGFc-binding protein [Deltaproteobacteria bacterium]